jgi:hypothetical protein
MGIPMTTLVPARCDSTISARVVRRWPLFYTAGADDLLDRPAHVRAGSGLTSIGGRLAVVQDDASFVAFIEPTSRTVDSIALAACSSGQRQFDDLRGNKHWKLDLETCATIDESDGELLIALGSGSSPRREQILLLTWPRSGKSDFHLYEAPAFYGLLRSRSEFAGSELNLEGAVYVGGDVLRLFQRGNGEPRDGLQPVNATCDISWPMLRSHLDEATPVPCPTNVIQYDLGLLDGVRLSFTDAATHENCIHFTATAEACPTATEDGPVTGSVLGQIGANAARWTILLDENGDRLDGKVEGLTFNPAVDNHGWLLIDRDDPLVPTELCEFALSGEWSGWASSRNPAAASSK